MIALKEAHRTTMKAIREKEVGPTNDELFSMKMKMLDEQIVIKNRMEKILNPKQFEKWNDLKKKLSRFWFWKSPRGLHGKLPKKSNGRSMWKTGRKETMLKNNSW